jgi:hypothetical protein
MTKPETTATDPSLMWLNDPFVVARTPADLKRIDAVLFSFVQSSKNLSLLPDNLKAAYSEWLKTNPAP